MSCKINKAVAESHLSLFSSENAVPNSIRANEIETSITKQVEGVHPNSQCNQVMNSYTSLPSFYKRFFCRLCKEYFTNKTLYEQHHHNDLNPCNLCDKDCFCKTKVTAETGYLVTKYKCKTCDKIFGSHEKLSYHLKTHSNTNLFMCGLCNERFSSVEVLREHAAAHRRIQDVPSPCSICSKVFKSRSALTRHQNLHSIEEHSCVVCCKKFISSTQLDKHMLTHFNTKEYSCEFCDRKFPKKSFLSAHMKCHNREKLFSCNVCQKSFVKSRLLKAHLEIHSENPFVCDFCFKAYSDKLHFEKHLLTHW